MRSSLLLILSGMLCCTPVFTAANAQDSSVLSLLRSKNKQIDDAMVKGDLTPSLDLFSSSVTITNPVGGFVGIEELSALVKSGTLKYTSLRTSEEKLAQYGTVAVLTFLSTDTGTMQGHDIRGKYRFTEVWAQQAGQWKIVAVQSTPVVPQP